MNKFNKRAQDSLDIQVVIDVFVQKVSTRCKAAVACGVANKVNALKEAKRALEAKLGRLLDHKAGGLISVIKNALKANKIKAELQDINKQIVEWINGVYRYYFA